MPQTAVGEEREDMAQDEIRWQRLENITKVTVANCTRYIAHVQRFMSDVLNVMDIKSKFIKLGDLK